MDSSKTCRITKEEAVPYQKLSNIMMGLDTQPKPQVTFYTFQILFLVNTNKFRKVFVPTLCNDYF